MIFCLWEKPSELDVFYETSCGDHYSSDCNEIEHKKCPYCNKTILDIDRLLDNIISVIFLTGRIDKFKKKFEEWRNKL